MTLVVACQVCGMAKMCAEGTVTTRCSHCGKTVHVGRAVVHYSGDDRKRAAETVFFINARAKGSGPAAKPGRSGADVSAAGAKARSHLRRRAVDDFLSGRSIFGTTEIAAWTGLGADETEKLVAKLLEAGRIMMLRDGRYAVVS